MIASAMKRLWGHEGCAGAILRIGGRKTRFLVFLKSGTIAGQIDKMINKESILLMITY